MQTIDTWPAPSSCSRRSCSMRRARTPQANDREQLRGSACGIAGTRVLRPEAHSAGGDRLPRWAPAQECYGIV